MSSHQEAAEFFLPGRIEMRRRNVIIDGELLPLRSASPTVGFVAPELHLSADHISDGSKTLLDALTTNPTNFFQHELQIAASSSTDHASTHNLIPIRSLEGTHSALPDRIIVFSGAQVYHDGKEITITLPDPAGKLYRVPGMEGMGHHYVDKTGRGWSVPNQEPPGAYSQKVLRNKVADTLRYGARYGIAIEGWGHHEKLTPECDWLVYSFPADALTTQELAWIDYNLKVKRGSLYGRAMYSLFGELNYLHAEDGITHGEAHPGNWLITPSGKIILKDWSTVQHKDALPRTPDIDEIQEKRLEEMDIKSRFPELSPWQLAIVLELTDALERNVNILVDDDSLVESHFQRFVEEIQGKPVEITPAELVRYELNSFLHAIAGYAGAPQLINIPETFHKATARLEQLYCLWCEKVWTAAAQAFGSGEEVRVQAIDALPSVEAFKKNPNRAMAHIRGKLSRQFATVLATAPQTLVEILTTMSDDDYASYINSATYVRPSFT